MLRALRSIVSMQRASGPQAHMHTCKASSQAQAPEVLSEVAVYQRYLTMYSRRIRFPQGQEHDFDVCGHPRSHFRFSVTFPFHPSTADKPAQVTLLREYCQGPDCMLYVLPTGGFDPRKHSSLQDCAAAEMSEEARLQGGTWLSLLEEGHPGIAEIKWGMNRFQPFICIDPEEDEQPGTRDAEELIEVQRYDIAELKQLLMSGDMLLPSVTTCYMALDRLRERRLL